MRGRESSSLHLYMEDCAYFIKFYITEDYELQSWKAEANVMLESCIPTWLEFLGRAQNFTVYISRLLTPLQPLSSFLIRSVVTLNSIFSSIPSATHRLPFEPELALRHVLFRRQDNFLKVAQTKYLEISQTNANFQLSSNNQEPKRKARRERAQAFSLIPAALRARDSSFWSAVPHPSSTSPFP